MLVSAFFQVRSLIDTDNPASIDRILSVYCSSSDRYQSAESSKGRASDRDGGSSQSPYIRHQQLARWYQSVVAPYRVRVDNLTTSFRSGLALLAVMRRYCPDVMAAAGMDENFYADLRASLSSPSSLNDIRSKAFDAIRDEFGLHPPLHLNDKEAMYQYLSELKVALTDRTPQPPPVSVSALRESPMRSVSSNQENEQMPEGLDGGRRYQRTPTAAFNTMYGQETEEQRQERYRKRLQV